MSLNEREKIHHQLLDALYTARKQVAYLEAALAHSAAFLGTGVEREGSFGVRPEDMVAPDALIRYLELVEPEADISDYIGSEGVDHTRPRLGPDAPDSIKPNKQPPVNAQVVNVALGHPDDFLDFPFKPGTIAPGTYLPVEDFSGRRDGPASSSQAPANGAVSSPSTRQAAGPDENRDAPSGTNDRADPRKSLFLVENVPTPGSRKHSPSLPEKDSEAPHPDPLPSSVQPHGTAEGRTSHAEKNVQSDVPRPVSDEECLRAHNAMQALGYGVWDWNMRSGNVFISTRWQEMMGRPSGNHPSALDTLTCNMHPDDGARLREALAKLRNSQTGCIGVRVRYRQGPEGAFPSSGVVHAAYQRIGGNISRLTVVLAEGSAPQAVQPAQRNQNVQGIQGIQSIQGIQGIQDIQSTQGSPGSGVPDVHGSHGTRGSHGSHGTHSARSTHDLHGVRGGGVHNPGADVLDREVRQNEARLAALYRLSRMDDVTEERMVRYCLGEAVRLTGSEFGYVYLAPRPGNEHGRVYWSGDFVSKNGGEPASPHFCGAPWSSQPECLLLRGPEVVNALEDAMARAFGGNVAVTRYMLVPIMEAGRVLCVAAVANKKNDYEASDHRQFDLFINGMWFHLKRRWAVKELEHAKEAAEAANLAKNEFLANISHELRTPLNGMLGMLQLLQKTPLNKEQADWVATAANSGRSLLRIISDILDFAGMESRSLRLMPSRFDFSASVRAALGLFSEEAKRRNLGFFISIDDAIPRYLVGDEARFRQILFNIVSNAFKFTPQGEIRVECSLLPCKKQGKHCIYIAVHDTGIGIPPEQQHKMFLAFTQLDGSLTRRFPGAGIGLAIVGQLVRLMDGSISLESEPGKGAVVHLSLPFDKATATPVTVGQLDVPGGIQAVPARHIPLDILAIEDDQVNQYALRTLLKRGGHEITCVPNGRMALEVLLLKPFDCVISDIQMPVMDGKEFIGRVRDGRTDDIEPGPEARALLGPPWGEAAVRAEIPNDMPIVALTAHALTGDRQNLLDLGASYFLPKPLVAADLEAILRHIGGALQGAASSERR